MQAGKLDRLVQIQANTRERDGGSGARLPPVWTTIDGGQVWAKKVPLNDRRRGEVFVAEQERVAQAEVAWEIRWLAGLTDSGSGAQLTILDDLGARWDITTVHEIGRREGLRLVARARCD